MSKTTNQGPDISKIDKNLAVETSISREGLHFYDAERAPLRIHGIYKENGVFRRMPEAVADQVGEGVYRLHTHSAGGRVRFVTDSPYVAVKTELDPFRMPHFAATGSEGFDMYVQCDGETRYGGTFIPPYEKDDSYEGVKDFEDSRERLITINFPLYSSVSKLYIGLMEGASLKEAPDYRIQKPVVYYGSSITQGGCASRPGNSYESIVSRHLDCDYVNLGFSGSAKAEEAMVKYIKGLSMSAFVMDYDYNAPSSEHLRDTHGKMFREIRREHPELPIILMPRPKYYLSEAEKERAEIVYGTYLAAKAAGDRNVYYISGAKLMEKVLDEGTVDGAHPTDYGFFSMACAVEEVLRDILK